MGFGLVGGLFAGSMQAIWNEVPFLLFLTCPEILSIIGQVAPTTANWGSTTVVGFKRVANAYGNALTSTDPTLSELEPKTYHLGS